MGVASPPQFFPIHSMWVPRRRFHRRGHCAREQQRRYPHQSRLQNQGTIVRRSGVLARYRAFPLLASHPCRRFAVLGDVVPQAQCIATFDTRATASPSPLPFQLRTDRNRIFQGGPRRERRRLQRCLSHNSQRLSATRCRKDVL